MQIKSVIASICYRTIIEWSFKKRKFKYAANMHDPISWWPLTISAIQLHIKKNELLFKVKIFRNTSKSTRCNHHYSAKCSLIAKTHNINLTLWKLKYITEGMKVYVVLLIHIMSLINILTIWILIVIVLLLSKLIFENFNNQYHNKTN